MSCIIKFFKNLIKKVKYSELDNQNRQNINTNQNPKSDSNDNLPALEQQKECCICFEEIKEKQLVCGHNIHIICILKSRKKTICPLCSSDISKDCIEHIKKCKNKKCICKNKSEMNDIQEILAHDLITSYINSLSRGKQINKNDLSMLLKRNNIENYDRIIGLYIG